MVEVTTEGRKVLVTPVTDEDLRDVRTGDIIYLTGDMVACRDAAHKRVVVDGQPLPVDMHGLALFHAGPIVRKIDDGRYEIVSVGPTTSLRMEKFEYDFVSITGTKVIIGKGGMRDRTAQACREFGAIQCAAPAGCAVVGAVSVEEVVSADWLDLGMPEAVWHCRVREFGPLLVTIDTTGRNYFDEKSSEYRSRALEQIDKLRAEL